MLKIALTIAAFAVHTAALAQATPVGLWKTIDDETKKEKSLVRISDNGGVFSGKIEKLLSPTAKQDAVCDQCSDDRKDKPKLGMEIIRGATKTAGKDIWEGGRILDPENGKAYTLRMTPIDGGKKLEVRGSILFFGRTQTWIRVQ